jgi:hypothetical protein
MPGRTTGSIPRLRALGRIDRAGITNKGVTILNIGQIRRPLMKKDSAYRAVDGTFFIAA